MDWMVVVVGLESEVVPDLNGNFLVSYFIQQYERRKPTVFYTYKLLLSINGDV